MALAGIAAGADGLIVEVHPNPKVARSDAAQQLTIPADVYKRQTLSCAFPVGDCAHRFRSLLLSVLFPILWNVP